MIRCLCGSENFCDYCQPSYRTIETGEQVVAKGKFGRCLECGWIRQLSLPFNTEEEYERFYLSYAPTTRDYRAKDWPHDLQLARSRADVYGISASTRRSMLDVGCGSGAFVHECRSRGQESFGCEISTYSYAKQSEFIYRQAFEKIGFPVDQFDVVTCHDVLEHSLNPIQMMSEMFRITKQGGTCVVDFPRFHHPAGTHHWKDAEHIWLLTEDQLVKLFQRVGFHVTALKNPIESKVVVYGQKPAQQRKTILVPPGLGDSYWTIVKMESFIEQEKIGIPDVIPVANRNTNHKTEGRSIDFIRMFPFLTSTRSFVVQSGRDRILWNEGYMLPARTVMKNVMGCDYFLSWNGHQRIGRQLEEVDPQLKCNWHPRMFVSLEQEQFKARSQADFGDYVVYYTPTYNVYQNATKVFSVDKIISSINSITKNTGCVPVLAGAKWDKEHPDSRDMVQRLAGCKDLMGQTSVEQLFGLLRGAKAVVGFPSGLTILSAVLRCPTLIIWNDYYNPGFVQYTCPPDTREVNYFIDHVNSLSPERLIAETVSLVKIGSVDRKVVPYPSLASRSAQQKAASKPPRPNLSIVGGKTRPPLGSFTPSTSSNKDVAVLCVLKSGGDFDQDYVIRLRNGVFRHSTINPRFFCLTDLNLDPHVCDTIKLEHNLPGWWSKLELFRTDLVEASRIVYFDLDTIIVNNIDELLQVKTEFAGLGAWTPVPDRGNKNYFGSGVMAWTPGARDWSFLLKEFSLNGSPKNGWNSGDQYYIVTSLINHQITYQVLQDLAPGIYSYKRNCLNGVPPNARVICFHGKPRPHQALGLKWLRNNWR